MSNHGKKADSSHVLKQQLKELKTIQHSVLKYAKQHPLRVMGASLIAGVAIAQLLRQTRKKGNNNGK